MTVDKKKGNVHNMSLWRRCWRMRDREVKRKRERERQREVWERKKVLQHRCKSCQSEHSEYTFHACTCFYRHIGFPAKGHCSISNAIPWVEKTTQNVPHRIMNRFDNVKSLHMTPTLQLHTHKMHKKWLSWHAICFVLFFRTLSLIFY